MNDDIKVILMEKDSLQNFYNAMAGNALILTQNIRTFMNKGAATHYDLDCFLMAISENIANMLEEIKEFGNEHELLAPDNEHNNDYGDDET